MTGTKIIIRFFVFLAIILIVIFGGWWWWQDSLSALDPADTTPVTFVVKNGDTVREIVNHLKAQELIKDQVAFFIFTKFEKLDGRMQAGDFRLSKAMSAPQIAQELTHGSVDVWVTVLEGWRKEEVAQKIAQSFTIPESEFIKSAREGYLFPDTYLFPKDASASSIVEIFKDNFDKKVDASILAGFSAHHLTKDEGITLASIVEREGNSDSDRPLIAGVLLNRLREGQPLQVDATLQYALGYQSKESSWWKKELSNDDKDIASPYNTYIHTGLPPGPISNPGISAIKAVANATNTDYFYYIHDPQGVAHFARTLDEHNANINKYL